MSSSTVDDGAGTYFLVQDKRDTFGNVSISIIQVFTVTITSLSRARNLSPSTWPPSISFNFEFVHVVTRDVVEDKRPTLLFSREFKDILIIGNLANIYLLSSK